MATYEAVPLNQEAGGGYRLGGQSEPAVSTEAAPFVARRRAPPGQTWGLALYDNSTPRQKTTFFLYLLGGALAILIASLQSISPLENGLLQNSWTSYVETDRAYNSGLHFVGIGKSFIVFPSTQISIVFSDSHAKGVVPDAGPISTRTGDDNGEEDSGGQPITICFSLQYRLPGGADLGDIYSAYGSAYHERYLLITRNVVSNVAQEFSPTDFWERRSDVADAMLAALQTALGAQGKVTVTQLQLLRIDFPEQYETMITNIQLQVQTKATKEYEQKVVGVLNDLSVLTAKNQATAGVIQAEAQRKSVTIENAARQQGLVLLQSAKANATKLVADRLEFGGSDTVQYLKLQAIRAHPSARTVVGVGDPFANSPLP
mmetsp:Transcript_85640/g.165940  ORF Transcript_85640/g.165940 Transcript_85640/m.165940 type:complete len:374 (+) Transcript_85640:190-1311(+)